MHYPGSACRGTDLPSGRLLYIHTLLLLLLLFIIIIIIIIIINIIIITKLYQIHVTADPMDQARLKLFATLE